MWERIGEWESRWSCLRSTIALFSFFLALRFVLADAADADTAADAVDELCLHVFCLCSVVWFVRACCCDAWVFFVCSIAIFISSSDSESSDSVFVQQLFFTLQKFVIRLVGSGRFYNFLWFSCTFQRLQGFCRCNCLAPCCSCRSSHAISFLTFSIVSLSHVLTSICLSF